MRCLVATIPLLAVAMVSGFPEAGTVYAQTVPPTGGLIGGQTPSPVPGGPIIGQPPRCSSAYSPWLFPS